MVSITNDHDECSKALNSCADHSEDDFPSSSALIRKHKALAFLFIPTAKELRRAKRRARRARNQRFQRYDLSLGQVVQSSMFIQYNINHLLNYILFLT